MAEQQKRGPGRPRKEETVDRKRRVEFRLSDEDLATLEAAATADGRSLAEFARHHTMKAAAKLAK